MTNKHAGLESSDEDAQNPPGGADSAIRLESVLGDTRRARHSFYLDSAVVRSLNHAYKKTSYDLYPREISKSDFLEECLRYALSYLDQIQQNLVQEK